MVMESEESTPSHWAPEKERKLLKSHGPLLEVMAEQQQPVRPLTPEHLTLRLVRQTSHLDVPGC